MTGNFNGWSDDVIWNLAEGFTGDGIETFILVQNPNDKRRS